MYNLCFRDFAFCDVFVTEKYIFSRLNGVKIKFTSFIYQYSVPNFVQFIDVLKCAYQWKFCKILINPRMPWDFVKFTQLFQKLAFTEYWCKFNFVFIKPRKKYNFELQIQRKMHNHEGICKFSFSPWGVCFFFKKMLFLRFANFYDFRQKHWPSYMNYHIQNEIIITKEKIFTSNTSCKKNNCFFWRAFVIM